jgi:threonine dehydrogenase-like Zn-dependent dehydrogenase
MRRRELTLVNIRRQCDCLEPALELIRRRRVAVAPLITHRFPLGEAGRAFELVARYGDGVVKAMLTLDA